MLCSLSIHRAELKDKSFFTCCADQQIALSPIDGVGILNIILEYERVVSFEAANAEPVGQLAYLACVCVCVCVFVERCE